jgi:hypothetical protein
MPYHAYAKELQSPASSVEVLHIGLGEKWCSVGIVQDGIICIVGLACTADDSLRIYNCVLPDSAATFDEDRKNVTIPAGEVFSDESLLREIRAGDPLPPIAFGPDEHVISRMILRHTEIDRPKLTIQMQVGKSAMSNTFSLN